MAKIKILNDASVEKALRRAVNRKMRLIFDRSKFLLETQAKLLQVKFRDSEEFNSLKTRFRGEFGFTDQEVANLDRILSLLVPDNSITKIKITTTPSKFSAILDWVDFRKLKAHEFAQHELTKLDAQGNIVRITDVVSWVEWLEEGETIRGYQFFRPNDKFRAFSRSGEGLMRKSDNNFWTFTPTRIFDRIGAEAEQSDFLSKGFGIIVKRLGKS